MLSDMVMIVSDNMHDNHKLESCHSHDNKQFHDFSMTSSYFPWLFGKFSYSKTFPWLSMTAIFSGIFHDCGNPDMFPFSYRSHSWSQCVKNFLSSLSHTVCVVLSVPLLFFSFLGAGTLGHPDSVGCVTDVIGLQCEQTSISITGNGGADYLESRRADGRYLRKQSCLQLQSYFRVFRNVFHRLVSWLAGKNGLNLQVVSKSTKAIAGLRFTVEK